MKIQSAKITGYRCFNKTWAGFDELRSINVIIGRNNVGKSLLLELVSALCSDHGRSKSWSLAVSSVLTRENLIRVFEPSTSGGELGGNFWDAHGKYFVGSPVRAVFNQAGEISEFELTGKTTIAEGLNGNNPRVVNARLFYLKEVAKRAESPISARKYRHLLAERDIQPETEAKELELRNNGEGATNIIRRFLVSSSDSVSRNLIQKDLLNALNEIFGPDGKFQEIVVRLHDESVPGVILHNSWEVFLFQEKKGLVSLSRSGSGLRTVVLVLLHLLVVPVMEHHTSDSYVYAFEELENNLHPSLLRRLLKYIERHVHQTRAIVFLTTHSSAALDFFGQTNEAQIIHIIHDGESATATKVAAHFDKVTVLSELGAKPSDLLQANGVLWVEGPSDRVYLNRWIELVSKGELREGKDYACAFYGGALLARTQFTPADEGDKELTNLLRINGNVSVVCDSDKKSPEMELKGRVARIVSEIRRIPGGHAWVTAAKEVENYIPGECLERIFESSGLPSPEQFDGFFPIESSSDSFVEAKLKRKSVNKTELAEQLAPLMTLENMQLRFDWLNEITKLVETIRRWNT